MYSSPRYNQELIKHEPSLALGITKESLMSINRLVLSAIKSIQAHGHMKGPIVGLLISCQQRHGCDKHRIVDQCYSYCVNSTRKITVQLSIEYYITSIFSVISTHNVYNFQHKLLQS